MVEDGLRARKRRDTQARIEAAALGLFEEQGFDDTTVDDIAAAAGVSRATVFRYFGSKDDIVYGIEPALLAGMRDCVRSCRTLVEAVAEYAAVLDAEVENLRERAAVIAMTPRLIERFAHVRTRWEIAVAHELAARRGPSTAPTMDDRVRAGIAMTPLYVAFLTWAVTPGATLAELTREALASAPSTVDPVLPPRDATS